MQTFISYFLPLLLISCNTDNMLVYEKEVEVPVYIEVEVPVPTDTSAEDADIWVDSFVQVRAVDGVDIIWVIDTSGSMTTHQANLLSGIETMMNALPLGGWRLIMVSTDPNAALVEQQFPLVPGDDIIDASNMYNSMQVGTREQGFDAVYTYIESNPYAATWMRDDAALLVVFVSDENDQSFTVANETEFINWYTARRFGNVFLASIVMLSDIDTICDPYPGLSYHGEAYIAATDMLFGTVVDICSEDWSPGVVDATTQIEPYDHIVLTNTPIPQTIRVFVDGSLSYDWYYTPADNTVYFTTIPGAGSLAEVGYVIQ